MSTLKPISEDSRLFKPTAASEPKFTGERINNIVPRQSSMIPDNSCAPAGGNLHLPSARTGSPVRKSEAYYRMFHGTGTISAMRGDGTNPAVAQGASANSSIRRGSDCAALSPNAHKVAHQAAMDRSVGSSFGGGGGRSASNASIGSRSGTPEPRSSSGARSGSAGGIRRSGKMNEITSAAPPSSKGGIWMSKPLSDGSRYTKTKKMFSNSPARETSSRSGTPGGGGNSTSDSPYRPGRRAIPQRDNVVGSSCNVQDNHSSSRTSTPHRVERFHRKSAPYLTSGKQSGSGGSRSGSPLSASNRDEQGFVGLMGYGPSGKRSIATADTMELLWHTKETSKNVQVKRGVQMSTESHKSHEPWALTQYSAEELNEKKFKPSVVVMHGPPPFRPSSPARGRSPHRGVGAPKDSDIFPVGGVPVVPFPHNEAPPVLSRTPGTYSPLRQAPPNSGGRSGRR